MASNIDCGCNDVNLDDNWQAEVPTRIDERIVKMKKEEIEEVLIVEVPEEEEYGIDFVHDWTEELAELLQGPDLLVTSEWRPGMDTLDKESDEYSLSTMTTMVTWRKQCPVCLQRPGCTVSRHIICNHLPWFAYPRNACWQCKVPVPQISRFHRHEAAAGCFGGQFREIHQQEWVGLINQMLRFLAEEFKVPGVLALLDHVRATPELCPPQDQPFTEDVRALMDLYQEVNGFTKHEYIMSPPNCVAAMLHWRTLALLISRLSPERQSALRRIEDSCTFLGEPLTDTTPRSIPVATDAHCHIDLLLQRTRTSTYQEAAEDFTFPDMEINLNVIIPCYAFPTMFPNRGQLELLPPSAKNFAAGFHPQSAQREYPQFMPKFRALAEQEEAVAIGEVGIDYTRGVHEGTIRKQHRLLEEVTSTALELGKPLVIHCRGGNVERSATLDCLAILRLILPKSYPVYVHCFTGGLQDYRRWIQAFPTVVFGFTGALLHPQKRHPKLLKVAAAMDLGRLLLETDAPLLLPPKYQGITKNSNPYMVVDIATEIGNIRHIPTEAVLAVTHRNTRRFFNLVPQ